MKYIPKKHYPNVLLMLLCILTPYSTIHSGMEWYGPLLFHFTHANFWHFLINALYLLQFCPRWTTVGLSYFIASACAEMPFVAMFAPTCGLSGMCFAMQARHDAAWRVLNWRLLGTNTIMAFFPMFNWKLHLTAYVISFAIWKLFYLNKERKQKM